MEDNRRVGQYKIVQWPKYVVAIRGTIATKTDDLIDDLRILFETMCQEVHLYKPIMHLLEAIYNTYGDDVWVAGHSLGATLGLIATRRLAIDKNIVLDCHYFNPPNISMDILAKKLVVGTCNGLAEGAAMIPLVGRATRQFIRGSCSVATSVAEGVARSAGKLLFSEKFKAAERGHDTLRARGYIPHLYVNPNDAFCNEYIKHFQGSDPPAVSSAVPITQLFIDAQSCHLIPLAYLHTNHWASGPHEAHKLHQWFLYDPVNLTSELTGEH